MKILIKYCQVFDKLIDIKFDSKKRRNKILILLTENSHDIKVINNILNFPFNILFISYF